MKLYLVKCQGMHSRMTGPAYGESYVVAEDPDHAYKLVRSNLDRLGIGFEHEREMLSVTLLAEESKYPECRTQLYVGKRAGGTHD